MSMIIFLIINSVLLRGLILIGIGLEIFIKGML